MRAAARLGQFTEKAPYLIVEKFIRDHGDKPEFQELAALFVAGIIEVPKIRPKVVRKRRQK